MFGLNAGYALVVRQHDLDAVPLALGAEALAQNVSDLRRGLVPGVGHLPEFGLKTSYALYQALLAPLEGHLTNMDRLIVVPGAALFELAARASGDRAVRGPGLYPCGLAGAALCAEQRAVCARLRHAGG